MQRLICSTVLALASGIQVFLASCAPVKPFEREYLALRIMDFKQEAAEEAIERHWIETLEASSGGIGGSGGGCACN